MGSRRWSFPETQRQPRSSPWLGFVLGQVSTLVVVAVVVVEITRHGVDLPWR